MKSERGVYEDALRPIYRLQSITVYENRTALHSIRPVKVPKLNIFTVLAPILMWQNLYFYVTL